MNASDVIAVYDRVAHTWARERNRSLFEKRWLDRFLSAAPRSSGRPSLLDLGCGSGEPIASYLAERGAQLTGVDGSGQMVGLYAATLPNARTV